MPNGIERGRSATFPEKRNFIDSQLQTCNAESALRPE